MKRKPPQDLTPLREWCEANGIKFTAAKSYQYKHDLSIEQTIAYYQSDRETLASMRRRHGISMSPAESYKRRNRCTKREAVEHCIRQQQGGNKRPTAARKAADRYGIDIKRLYYVMSIKRCGAEKAAQSIAAKDRAKAVPGFAHPINPLLARAWV